MSKPRKNMSDKGAGISFIRAGTVGIETGKYQRYLPVSGQEEKLIPEPRISVELRGFGGAAHQQGFSEHSLRKPLARANAQPAFATSPRQPSRVRIPQLIKC